jgi:hypothetical protein
VDLNNVDVRLELPSGPLLSQFLRESPKLQEFVFYAFDFKEEHCRALATLQRHDLDITLQYCTFEPQDSEDAFIEWFRYNQVVTELDSCDMDSNLLSALSGNNSVKKLTIENYTSTFGEEKARSLAQALPGNMGIEHLAFSDNGLSDEIWSLLFRSLSTHPRIKILSIESESTFGFRNSAVPNILVPLPCPAESKTKIMKAIIQMLRLNIEFPGVVNNGEVYRNSILPRLEMNRACFEVQRQAVKRADPSIRPQLLGRALYVVRYNLNLLFQILSENIPAFVRAEEEEDSVIPLENDPIIVSG